MTIKEKALHWWAETIKEGKNVVSSADIPNQRQRTFLVKEKFIVSVARGYWLLKRPEDDIKEVFPLLYWETIEAVLSRYTWSVSGLSAVIILNGGQGVQKELIVATKEKTNWKLPLIDDFSISIRHEPHFDERMIMQTKVTKREIPVDIPEKVFVDTNKLDLPEIQNFIAGTNFDLRKLEAIYARKPKPIIFKRLIGKSKSANRLDLVAELERIINTYTHYHVGKRDIVESDKVVKKTKIKPPWIIRQESQVQEFEKALDKHLVTEIKRIKKHSLNELLNQAKEHKKYDTYHSTTLEGYKVTPEEVDILLSGIASKGKKTQGKNSAEEIKNRMAILGYSEAFDFVIKKIQEDFRKPKISEDLIKDIYYHLFKPSADAGITDYMSLVSYRTTPAFIRTTIYVPPSYEKLVDLMMSYTFSTNKINNPIVRAVLAHYFFVTIHPYSDGNGRTARLLMNYLLLAAGYPWVTIRVDQRVEYFGALKKGQLNNDILPFGSFIIDILKQVKVV